MASTKLAAGFQTETFIVTSQESHLIFSLIYQHSHTTNVRFKLIQFKRSALVTLYDVATIYGTFQAEASYITSIYIFRTSGEYGVETLCLEECLIHIRRIWLYLLNLKLSTEYRKEC